ncbi:hypothetical protein T492DRAFT_858516 [Pavlovales sp. CCMP2436]|nr:hypothetical protein T492DRAFT_858516 [Pavlovales sp. CCMP2436]
MSMNQSSARSSAGANQSFGGSQSVRRSGASVRSKSRANPGKQGDASAGPRKLVPDPAHPGLTVWDGARDVTPLSLVKGVHGSGNTPALSEPGATTGSASGELQKSGGMSTSMQESSAMASSMRDDNSFSDVPTAGSQPHVSSGGGGGDLAAWSAAGRNSRVEDVLNNEFDSINPLSAGELAAPMTLTLSETDTFFWLDLEGNAVGKEVQAEHAKAF